MQMPCNPEAEKQLLGYVLMEGERADLAFQLLKPEDFYVEGHRKIYKQAAELFEKNEYSGAASLTDKFNPQEIAELMNESCLTSQVEGLAKNIKKHASHRKLIQVLNNYRNEAVSSDDVEGIVNKLSEAVTGIALNGRGDSYITSKDLMSRVYDTIELRHQGKGTTGIPTGFTDLDRFIGGWQRQHLVFLGAVPKMGKTSVALEWLTSAAQKGYSGLFFSLEMSLEEVGDRQVSAFTGLENTKIRSGKLSDEDFIEIGRSMSDLSSMNIGWVDRAGITATEIKAICRQYKMRHGLDLVVIDQLDKIAGNIKQGENEAAAIKRNIVALKTMAQELDCTVICLCQLLDKVVSNRTVPRPQHGDEKGSSAPSEDADIVMFLWRPEFYWPGSYKGKAELIIARQRTGPAGSIWLSWRPKTTKFADMPFDDWPKEVRPPKGE